MVSERVLVGLRVWVAVGWVRKDSGSGFRTAALSHCDACAAPSPALVSALAGLLLLPPQSQRRISQQQPVRGRLYFLLFLLHPFSCLQAQHEAQCVRRAGSAPLWVLAELIWSISRHLDRHHGPVPFGRGFLSTTRSLALLCTESCFCQAELW